MGKTLKGLSAAMSAVSTAEIMALVMLYSRSYHSKQIGFSTGKPALTALFIGGMLVFCALFLLKRFPRLFPFPVKITPANMRKQAILSGFFISLLSMFTTPVFGCLMYMKYRSILYEPASVSALSPAVPAVFAGICIGICILYIIISRLINKQEHKN